MREKLNHFIRKFINLKKRDFRDKENQRADSEAKFNFKNQEYQKMVNEVNYNLKKRMHSFDNLNYNPELPAMFPCYENLKDFLENEILYVYVMAKSATLNLDQEIYGNALCRNLCSFIDLYSQSLNMFYKLGLKPLRQKFSIGLNPNDNVVDKIIDGKIKYYKGKSKITNWNAVKNEIERKYNLNNYYIKAKDIIDSDNIRKMKQLRNYSIHYQPLFSRFEMWYDDESTVFDVHPIQYDNKEYSKFIELSHKVMNQEIKLLECFEGMFFDKKMIRKGENEKVLYEFACQHCHKGILLVANEFKKIVNDRELIAYCPKCKSDSCFIDYKKTITVHPEKYNQILLADIKKVKIKEL